MLFVYFDDITCYFILVYEMNVVFCGVFLKVIIGDLTSKALVFPVILLVRLIFILLVIGLTFFMSFIDIVWIYGITIFFKLALVKVFYNLLAIYFLFSKL